MDKKLLKNIRSEKYEILITKENINNYISNLEQDKFKLNEYEEENIYLENILEYVNNNNNDITSYNTKNINFVEFNNNKLEELEELKKEHTELKNIKKNISLERDIIYKKIEEHRIKNKLLMDEIKNKINNNINFDANEKNNLEHIIYFYKFI